MIAELSRSLALAFQASNAEEVREQIKAMEWVNKNNPQSIEDLPMWMQDKIKAEKKARQVNIEKEIMPIVKAIEITAEIPEINEILIDLYENEAEFVELGIVDGEIIVKQVTGPTVDSVHVDSIGEDEDEKKKKRKPVIIVTGGYTPLGKAEGDTPVVEEQRYTFSPWYVPDSVDAHGEWADKDEVQQAFWRYLALDDRDIRLQHNVDIVAGQWVEGATWPYEVTLPVKHPEGDIEYTFPAGTPFLGIIWEPWAWDLIKEGKIRGLSIGGTARRIEGDLGESDKEYSREVSFATKMIHEVHGKYVVFDDEMTRTFGVYDTEEEAESRLSEIERFAETDKAKSLSVGDTVSFSVPKPPEGNMIARGIITSVKRDGRLTLPNTNESVEATEENPAAIVRVYIEDGDEWVESDRSVVKPFTELREIEEFTKADVSAKVKEQLQDKVKTHNESVTAESKKANLRMLIACYKRGIGAYQTNPSSVRPTVSSAEQWAMGRVNGLLHALKTGRFKRGKFDTDLLPSGHPLSTKKSLEKAETFTPPKGVQEEAQMAQGWIADGHAGSNFTSVGRRRASQLANGQAVSLDTIRRMNSYLARHSVDSKAEGFNYGEDGFPSPGRVAWSAWGGDPAVSWVKDILSRYDD
jgi:hypothetical protein